MSGNKRLARLQAQAKKPSAEAAQPISGPICFECVGELETLLTQAVIGEQAGLMEAEKWIQKAIKKPGRCTGDALGGSDCPKGSPQYNLAMRLKPGGDLYKQIHKKGKK
jgi:hypothetical protein